VKEENPDDGKLAALWLIPTFTGFWHFLLEGNI
jgi:hypothetical protein